MRKIKSKERQNGMKYCSFCKPAKVDAVYRNTKLRCDKIEEKLQFACEGHKYLLVDGTAEEFVRTEYKDSGHMTEADYQTWWRV